MGRAYGMTMTKTVLIVEDNELNMKLFNDLLEAYGYRTIKTMSGQDAMSLARAHRPDVILMDIQLPEVSGLDVTKWLKADEELKSIPVVAVTAFAMKGDEEKIRQGGCEDYVSKPISIIDFMRDSGVEYIDLLKLDCEGSEFSILDALAAEPSGLQRRVGCVRAEVHATRDEARFIRLMDQLRASFPFVDVAPTGSAALSMVYAWR